MRELICKREAVVWIILMIATCISWWFAANHGEFGSSPKIGIVFLLGLAFIKIRLIMFYFMEVRDGPLALRWSADGWILFTLIGLILFLFGVF